MFRPMAHVTFQDVRKVYGENEPAVDGLNFSVADGEFMVLVGPSGCGKSSTLRMVAGLESVTSGSIFIDGSIVNNTPPKDRDVAMVFQNYALYPHMTVFNNMAFGLKLRKYAKTDINQRVGEAAELLGITDILNRKPKQLSGGERQRVAVGRAIVRKPKVFLFDEPLSNLDATLRVQMRTELARLHRELHATMIYVTHDQTEAMTLGKKIAVMNQGIIQQIADPQTLYGQPQNRFVAGFIGSPAMNFADGFVEKVNGSCKFVSAKRDWWISIPSDVNFHSPKVCLGFRPETVRPAINHALKLGDGILEAQIVLEEHFGAESHIHVETSSGTFVIRVSDTSNFGIKNKVKFALNRQRIHLFDSDTGQAIR